MYTLHLSPWNIFGIIEENQEGFEISEELLKSYWEQCLEENFYSNRSIFFFITRYLLKRTGISILFWICNRKEKRVIVYCRKMAVPDLQFKNNTRRIWFLPIVKFYRREEVQSCGRKVGHFINLFVSTSEIYDRWFLLEYF